MTRLGYAPGHKKDTLPDHAGSQDGKNGKGIPH